MCESVIFTHMYNNMNGALWGATFCTTYKDSINEVSETTGKQDSCLFFK